MGFKVHFYILFLHRELAEFKDGKQINRPTRTLDRTDRSEDEAADFNSLAAQNITWFLTLR